MERGTKITMHESYDPAQSYTFGELLALRRGEPVVRATSQQPVETTQPASDSSTETSTGRTFHEILYDQASIDFRAEQRTATHAAEVHIPDQRTPEQHLGHLGLDQIA